MLIGCMIDDRLYVCLWTACVSIRCMRGDWLYVLVAVCEVIGYMCVGRLYVLKGCICDYMLHIC